MDGRGGLAAVGGGAGVQMGHRIILAFTSGIQTQTAKQRCQTHTQPHFLWNSYRTRYMSRVPTQPPQHRLVRAGMCGTLAHLSYATPLILESCGTAEISALWTGSLAWCITRCVMSHWEVFVWPKNARNRRGVMITVAARTIAQIRACLESSVCGWVWARVGEAMSL